MIKRNHRFNLIDYFVSFGIVLVVIVSFTLFSASFDKGVFTGVGKNNVVITIKTELLSDDYFSRLSPGQTVINFENGEELGVISDVELIEDRSASDSDMILSYAFLKVISDAEVRDNQYYLNNEKILVNKITSFSIPELYFEGEIISVYSSQADN